MEPAHYKEFINVVNNLHTDVKMHDTGGCLGCGTHAIGYVVTGTVFPIDEAYVAYYEDKGVEYDPTRIFSFYNKVDGRKKKFFKFKDYVDVYTLAEDVIAYIKDTALHYRNTPRNSPKMKRKIERISKEINEKYANSVFDIPTQHSQFINALHAAHEPINNSNSS